MQFLVLMGNSSVHLCCDVGHLTEPRTPSRFEVYLDVLTDDPEGTDMSRLEALPSSTLLKHTTGANVLMGDIHQYRNGGGSLALIKRSNQDVLSMVCSHGGTHKRCREHH